MSLQNMVAPVPFVSRNSSFGGRSKKCAGTAIAIHRCRAECIDIKAIRHAAIWLYLQLPPPTAFLQPRQTAFAGFGVALAQYTITMFSLSLRASGLYTPVRLHLHMQDPQCRGYSSPAVDTHPCSHSSHHSHPLAQRRICQCCHPAHPVRKQHRGPVRSVLCR